MDERENPFDEETMMLIMGLGEPEKPGQHGRTRAPLDKTCVEFITNIRDMCDEFLKTLDKGEPKENKDEFQADTEEREKDGEQE